ncbi:hypothetical protein [Parabacteroides distasonis]|jgi:hypothetical protein|uniref:hypothetical protein n=2 Tax=Parabacteroides distasonis TaxID=823 RepID=UPI000F000B43|nr:hypothetical protein [Parabacteroides distasonis]RKU75906.1 hypothetical protein DW945_21890 [Parabacteroides sp. AM44-16]UBD81809.1 hypothetical protein K6V20_10400 [Parabacteroides distasonis]
METIPFIEYIKELIKQAHRYQNTKISTGECFMPKYKFGIYKWCFIVTSLLFFVFSGNYDPNILNTFITALSILVGLLANLLMTVYNMFLKLDGEIVDNMYKQRILEKKATFLQQFGYLNAYAILLSVLCIILCIMIQLPSSPSVSVLDLFQYDFSFELDSILFTVFVWGYSVVKSMLVYFVLDLLYIVIYSISSFVDYLNEEISRIKER